MAQEKVPANDIKYVTSISVGPLPLLVFMLREAQIIGCRTLKLTIRCLGDRDWIKEIQETADRERAKQTAAAVSGATQTT